MILTHDEQMVVSAMRADKASHPDKNVTGFWLDICAGKHGYIPEQVAGAYRAFLGHTGQKEAANGL